MEESNATPTAFIKTNVLDWLTQNLQKDKCIEILFTVLTLRKAQMYPPSVYPPQLNAAEERQRCLDCIHKDNLFNKWHYLQIRHYALVDSLDFAVSVFKKQKCTRPLYFYSAPNKRQVGCHQTGEYFQLLLVNLELAELGRNTIHCSRWDLCSRQLESYQSQSKSSLWSSSPIILVCRVPNIAMHWMLIIHWCKMKPNISLRR